MQTVTMLGLAFYPDSCSCSFISFLVPVFAVSHTSSLFLFLFSFPYLHISCLVSFVFAFHFFSSSFLSFLILSFLCVSSLVIYLFIRSIFVYLPLFSPLCSFLSFPFFVHISLFYLSLRFPFVFPFLC